jgi:DNA-binding protein Fis
MIDLKTSIILELGYLPSKSRYSKVLREIENTVLTHTIDVCGGNVSAAARLLGINRSTVKNRLDKHEINKRSHRPSRPDVSMD